VFSKNKGILSHSNGGITEAVSGDSALTPWYYHALCMQQSLLLTVQMMGERRLEGSHPIQRHHLWKTPGLHLATTGPCPKDSMQKEILIMSKFLPVLLNEPPRRQEPDFSMIQLSLTYFCSIVTESLCICICFFFFFGGTGV
jgi:hypothetical protein